MYTYSIWPDIWLAVTLLISSIISIYMPFLVSPRESVMVQRFYRNELKCVGSIPHESKVILITDSWIRPAPRASGLC
jgi:hypothetical protein